MAQSKRAKIARILRRCPLFAGLAQADLNAIAAMTVTKALVKGEYLFWEGSPVHGFYIVQRGAIKIYRANLLGKEQVLHVFRPMESFAEETLFSDLGYPADACATEPSQVLLVQKAGFIAMLKRQPELALCLLRSISRQVSLLVGLLDDLTLKDVKTRLAQWLIRRCPDPNSSAPQRIELPVTKRMLAAELGISSETFSRTLAKFRSQKLLVVEDKAIILLNPIRMGQLLRRHAAARPRWEFRLQAVWRSAGESQHKPPEGGTPNRPISTN